MENIIFKTFDLNDYDELYKTAYESWEYTYKDVYSLSQIKNYVDKYYSKEAINKLLPLIEEKNMFFCVAKEGKKVIGYSNVIIKSNDDAELLRIYLKPSFIGKGIGKKLLLLGEDFLKSKKINKYYCYMHQENKIGLKFYLKNGFKEKGKEPNPLFNNESDYLFEKEIR